LRFFRNRALLKAEVRDENLFLLPADGSGDVPVQGADVPDVPAVRGALPEQPEAEGTGVCEGVSLSALFS
jgi:hypothetical protein